MVDEEFVSSY